ncbi:hypothetical protein POX_a00200 [Penicillium oxalicum]|uniref:hypothetical protein n=1 Tax=Penicillium oxalicum TaxID=69781 RepID=UPI0020B708CF|nr:hypothetical protein POX_a00200 [Penicillium oxalicum]KAI2793619.1 hypothetical protein POX_a00200 [Penicillium oxalicum]
MLSRRFQDPQQQLQPISKSSIRKSASVESGSFYIQPDFGFANAYWYPFLMHAMLAVALTYDRYLNNSSESRRTLEECDHWSRSTTLFNVKLRGPILDGDKDPVWGTAAAQVILTFASPDARTPEESWPLSPSSSFSDVDWVRMSDGKMSLWNIVNPLRPDSIFHVMSTTFQQMQSPLPEGNTDDLLPELLAMCHIDQWTNPENNPYLHAVSALSVIMNVPDRQLTMGQTQLFMRCIQGEFRDLLCAKDPAALLLLYLWFKKTGRSIWWIDLRARVECPAIRLYLTQHHGADNAIQAILSGKAAIGS